MLVEQGRLSPEQRQQAQLYMERDQVDEDEALLQGHLLGYPQVLRALQQRLTLWVQRLMRLEGARFALYPMPRLPRHYSTPPVSLARVAYQMRRQEVAQLSADQLLAQSQHLRGKQIACVATPFSVHELQLAPDELRLHQKLSEDGYTLEELLEDGPMQEEPLRVTLLAFLHLDMARLRPERSLQMFRGELRQQRLFLAGADHFEALGVHWSAHQEEIEEAWGRMQRRWGPRQLPSGAGQAVREQLEQMRARLATSYQKLRAGRCRRAYREQLITPEQLKDAIQLYYRQGDAALLRKNYDEAESCMLRVLELDPRHGGARVKLKAAQDRRPRAGQ
jgi:tetratricopeptide (TPR) repeat protein